MSPTGLEIGLYEDIGRMRASLEVIARHMERRNLFRELEIIDRELSREVEPKYEARREEILRQLGLNLEQT